MKPLSIGVTVALRQDKGHTYQYFAQSLRSLRASGCGQGLTAFTEPGAAVHIPNAAANKVEIVQRPKQLGCFQNFRHGLKWLMEHDPAAWYLMLQDDCVWRRDAFARLTQLIGQPEMQGIGMLSLYTSRAMVPPKEKKKDRGKVKPVDRTASCAFYNRAFWGAVAMAFPAAAAAALDAHPRYANHDHTRKLDVVVGNTLRVELGLDIRICLPSLCDHIGAVSTLGRHKIKSNQWGRHGYLWRER